MAEGGYLKMRILNYYCNRNESECRSIMCGRLEAACYSIEYIFIDDDEKMFPSIANTQTSFARQEIIN